MVKQELHFLIVAFGGDCYDNAGNSNNIIKDNKILNNNVGIFSQQSNSTINNHKVKIVL